MNEKLMRLLTLEQFIPVMSKQEQTALLSGVPFRKGSLQKWKEELERKNEALEAIFKRAYDKQNKNGR